MHCCMDGSFSWLNYVYHNAISLLCKPHDVTWLLRCYFIVIEYYLIMLSLELVQPLLPFNSC
jgi:hypothetical protein